MLQRLLLLFILVFQWYIASTEDVKCEISKESTTYYYKCPISKDQNLEVSVLPPSIIKIKCDNIDIMNETVLPEINFGRDFGELHIHNCPIIQNGFGEILDRFHIDRLFTFKFYRTSNNELFQTHHFLRLESIRSLKLGYKINYFDGNIFKLTPHLSELYLRGNNLQLYDDIFKHISKLMLIDLQNNNISCLTHNVFRGLINLKIIYLENNSIKSLDSYVFRDLINLEDLRLEHNLLFRIDENAFQYQEKLRTLDISYNKLEYIPERTFVNCTNLEKIFLRNNENLVLENKVFSEFLYLNLITLNYNDITTLPENTFTESRNFIEIDLRHNKLKSLHKDIFKDLEHLEILYLNNNKIETLHVDTFSSLSSLRYLTLKKNLLSTVNQGLLHNLKNLENLNLSFNKIYSIDSEEFTKKYKLTYLSINNNMLDFDEFSMMDMKDCRNIRLLNVANNSISQFPYLMLESLMSHSSNKMNTSLKHHPRDARKVIVLMQKNNITNVRISRLRSNNSHSVSFPVLVQVDISENPINCDCLALDLVPTSEAINDRERDENRIVPYYNKLFCASPSAFANTSVKEVDVKKLVCSLSNKCTPKNECDCSYKSATETVIIDCSKRNMTEVPKLVLEELPKHFDFIKLNRVKVHLEDNNLEQGPTALDGYNNIQELYLERNNLKFIEWLPSSVEVLNIENNQLESIDSEILKMLNESTVRELRLSNNPWRCDCTAKDFITYLWTNILKIGNASHIRCQAHEKPLVFLDEDEFCPVLTVLVSVLSSGILICFLIISTIIFLYYIYREEILIWLYARGTCLCLIKEERIDKNKKYDAFVSFAHQDEEFVMDRLIPILELGSPQYKFCVHLRDWIPGEYIETQISNSVRDSRRTLIILSPNFIQSVWGRMEFRTAHTSAMKEGLVRVILVIYGDVEMDQLDDELKAYIRTNTYIKWGDPWFWEKLKYALPRTRHQEKKSTERNHQNSGQNSIELS